MEDDIIKDLVEMKQKLGEYIERTSSWVSRGKVRRREYSDTEIKMLDVGEALLISEPKIRFSVPIKVTHYPEYLEEREEVGYELPESRTLSRMDERLRTIRRAGKAMELSC